MQEPFENQSKQSKIRIINDRKKRVNIWLKKPFGAQGRLEDFVSEEKR